MSYLLDTCVISETTRPRPASAVVSWLKRADPEALYLSVVTIGEIEKGIERLPTGSRKLVLREWFEELRTRSAERLLSVDEKVAVEWGRLLARSEKKGDSVPVIDAMLGATAIVHGLTVVTRNTSDIGRTGAAIVDPWAE